MSFASSAEFDGNVRTAASILCEILHSNDFEEDFATDLDAEQAEENRDLDDEEKVFIIGRLSPEWRNLYQKPAIEAYVNWYHKTKSSAKVASVWHFFENTPEGQRFLIRERLPRSNEIKDADLSENSDTWIRIYDLINRFEKCLP